MSGEIIMSSLRMFLIDLITSYDDQINLGLIYLESYIDKIGHNVRIVDMEMGTFPKETRVDYFL
jgi:hypothetical protein